MAGDTVGNAMNLGSALPDLTVWQHDPASLHESFLINPASGGHPFLEHLTLAPSRALGSCCSLARPGSWP